MFRILITVLFTLSTVSSIKRPQYSKYLRPTSAASESQIKFALENNYDSTGPNKMPVYAYSTFNNLEDALIAYLDDPDTKLPEQDKAKGINKLITKLARPPSAVTFLKNTENYFIQGPKPSSELSANLEKIKVLYSNEVKPNVGISSYDLSHTLKYQREPMKVEKINFSPSKDGPLTLSHYSKNREHFNAFPRYSYSYGVNDKSTGDFKEAAESRDGDVVRGYYSFLDSDGKHRLVHYTAGGRHGFKANIMNLPLRN